MKAFEVIKQKVEETGIPIAELARRSNQNNELLRRSLEGKRKMQADEFLSVCAALGLTFEDFKVVRQV